MQQIDREPWNQTSRLLSVPEFASALGVTVACIRRWVLERRLASVRVGRLVRLPESELQRIVRDGFRPARPRVGER
jgi:excisionase family DNA binding protein